MKYPRKNTLGLAFLGLIQLIFLVVAIQKHDWFYLGVVYLLNSNVYRVIRYDGDEDE